MVRFAAGRLRALGGLREFVGVRLLGLAHDGLLASGRELAEQGALERAEDIFFLRLDELRAATADGRLARGGRMPAEWPALVATRRALYERERRHNRLPRVLLSDGRAFYEGVMAQDTRSGAAQAATPDAAARTLAAARSRRGAPRAWFA